MAHADPAITRLLQKFGPQAYGVYWLIVEEIAAPMEAGRMIPSAIHSVETWSKICHCSTRTFQKLTGSFVAVSLFVTEEVGTKHQTANFSVAENGKLPPNCQLSGGTFLQTATKLPRNCQSDRTKFRRKAQTEIKITAPNILKYKGDDVVAPGLPPQMAPDVLLSRARVKELASLRAKELASCKTGSRTEPTPIRRQPDLPAETDDPLTSEVFNHLSPAWHTLNREGAAKIVHAARATMPDVSLAELVRAFSECRKPNQNSAMLFVKTVPEQLKKTAQEIAAGYCWAHNYQFEPGGKCHYCVEAAQSSNTG